jgi:penicillin-binding protein 1A
MQKILNFLRTVQKFIAIGFKVLVGLVVLMIVSVVGLYMYLEPQLPSIDGLKDVQLQVPLRAYTANGGLISEFGEKRRSPKALADIPEKLRQAFLAAEDDRFYEHPGVDYQGILRAALNLATTGERGQGGSTITMQLARNLYLTNEKTYTRKLSEILLALKIEQVLSKDQILELYLNKIYLGNRAYGVAAAAQVYYGKQLEDLDLAEMSMIAGLPKAPSAYNPIINPDRATIRRDYVLGRMHALGYITEEEQASARALPSNAGLHDSPIDVSAAYVAEMVRAEMVNRFGEDAYTTGLKVYTTIDSRLQEAANSSLRQALLEYDQRHGYRGAERNIELATGVVPEEQYPEWDRELGDEVKYGDLLPALVVGVAEKTVQVYLKGGTLIELPWEALSWAAPYKSTNSIGNAPEKPEDVVKRGDVIRVYKDADKVWHLAQIPEVQGALVALDPNDGSVRALVGGYDFYRSKFNRAVQAKRQIGSSVKPFIYTAALEKGFTAASIINDAPVVFQDAALEGAWRPENYGSEFHGPTRLREALVHSMNLVSIRILRAIGIGYAINSLDRFGFNGALMPHDLTLALGSGQLSPLELAGGFSVFANGGYKVGTYFIQRIEDMNGKVLFEANPVVACVPCEMQKRGKPMPTSLEAADAAIESGLPTQAGRVIEDRIVYVMDSILQDVVNRGTARRARALGRNDLMGKTGTTNDQRDAWFNGFNRSLVAVSWVGFDEQQKQLGAYETGSKAALPMWMDFMRTALQGVPEKVMERPDNLVTVKINPETGELAGTNDKTAIFETFSAELAPKPDSRPAMPLGADDKDVMPEQLF